MTTFVEDELSASDSQPREVYEFVLPTVTYRLASGVRDVVLNGQTFRATTIAREAAQVTTASNEAALEIPILVTHALPQRYLRHGVPPHRIDVTAYRKQITSGGFEQVWVGRVQSLAIDRHIAKFLVPARTSDALQRRIPTITMGRECPHVLYDSNCRVSEAAYQISCTIVSVNGADVTCSSNAAFAIEDWFKYGRLIHVASGEYASISKQTSTLVTLVTPLLDMKAGDSILLSAGCSHDVDTCLTKFNNVPNYGGMPAKPSGNPFLPGSRGIFALKQLFGD